MAGGNAERLVVGGIEGPMVEVERLRAIYLLGFFFFGGGGGFLSFSNVPSAKNLRM